MTTTTDNNDERRQAYRAGHQAYLMLDGAVLARSGLLAADESLRLLFARTHALMSELWEIDQDLQRICHSVSERQQPLVGGLRLLDRKLGALANWSIATSGLLERFELLEIVISEGGIDLQSTLVCQGEDLLLQGLLLPGYFPLQAMCRVTPQSGDTRLRLAFESFGEEQSSSLGRYLLQVQQSQRRNQREADTTWH